VAGYEPLSIDLRLLESFVILAEELHFTRAAERLHIAQPALSQHIGRLERQLGAKLLTRPPLPVSLTPAGQEFRARAGAALADLKAAVSAARAVADGTAGDLTIAHLSSYAPHVIPAIAGAFTTAYPEMTLHLSEGSIEEQIDGIRAHDVDVAMFHLDPDNRLIEIGVEQHVIASAPQFVVLPVHHRYALHSQVDMADLLSEAWIAPGVVGSVQSRNFTALCARHGFVPRVVQHTNSIETILGLVRAGFGIATAPWGVVLRAPSDVALVPLAGVVYDVVLARPATHGFRTAAAERFVAVARTVVAEQIATAASSGYASVLSTDHERVLDI
jgi:DNA-binding transcriptional LysR family regulator